MPTGGEANPISMHNRGRWYKPAGLCPTLRRGSADENLLADAQNTLGFTAERSFVICGRSCAAGIAGMGRIGGKVEFAGDGVFFADYWKGCI